MKKNKNAIYIRYEFSDETGRPEGADILQFSSIGEAQQMTAEVLKVAHSDKVTVNLTIGQETPFFGFLKKVGVSRKDAESEMADRELAPIEAPKKAAKKKSRSDSGQKKVKSSGKTGSRSSKKSTGSSRTKKK